MITGTELLDALQRSGSSFSQFNMGTREAIAAIATLSTTTARTGSTIGNTFKSVAANFSMDKAIEALDAYDIKLYDVNENGMKVMRQGANVFQELQNVFAKLDDEGRSKLALAISGGKYQVNAMLAFLGDANGLFTQFIEDMRTKSSDAMTASLLKMGLETYQVKLMQLQASFQALGKTIGDETLPGMKKLTDGLTEGVMYLIKHKTEVANVVSALGKLVEAVMLYRGWQLLTNSAVTEGAVALRAMYLLEGNFRTAFAGMTASLAAFTRTLMTTTMQALLFYAAAEAINNIANGTSGFGQKNEVNELQKRIRGDEDLLTSGVAMNGETRSGLESQIAANKARLTELQSAEVNKATSNAEKLANDMFTKIASQQLAGGGVSTPSLTNQIPDKNKSGSGPTNPSERLFRDQLTMEKNSAFLAAKVSADNYSMALDNVNTREQLFGVTSQSTATKLALMRSRLNELNSEGNGFNSTITDLQKELDEVVNSDAGLKQLWEVDKAKYTKKEFQEINKELLQQHQTAGRIVRLMQEYEGKVSDIKKQANGLTNELLKVQLKSPSEILNNQNRITKANESYDLSTYRLNNRFNPTGYLEEAAIKLKAIQEEAKHTQEAMNAIQLANPDYQNDAGYLELKAKLQSLKVEAVEVGDKFQGIRKYWADTFADMVIEGKNGSEILQGIIKQLAKEAIYQMFRVKQQSTILGGLGKGKGKGSGMPNLNFAPQYNPATSYKNGFSTKLFHNGGMVQKYHSGGVTTGGYYPYLKNNELPAILEENERVLSKNDNKIVEGLIQHNMQLLKVLSEIGSKQQQSSQPIIINAVDSQSFVELMRNHGDAMVGILREQGAMNNKY